MVFNTNQEKLISILGAYNEDFLAEYQAFIAKFPPSLLAQTRNGKEFDKKTPNGRYAYDINSKFTKYVHNLSMFDANNTFSILKVCPIETSNLKTTVNKVLSLNIQKSLIHSRTYSFSIYQENGKNFVKFSLEKGIPHNKISQIHELSDEDFNFIFQIIEKPFDNHNIMHL